MQNTFTPTKERIGEAKFRKAERVVFDGRLVWVNDIGFDGVSIVYSLSGVDEWIPEFAIDANPEDAYED